MLYTLLYWSADLHFKYTQIRKTLNNIPVFVYICFCDFFTS